jgi:type VI secretion system VgrG family protein
MSILNAALTPSRLEGSHSSALATNTTTWALASEANDVPDDAFVVVRVEAVHALSRMGKITVDVQPSGHDDVVREHLDGLMTSRVYLSVGEDAAQRFWGVIRSVETLTLEAGVKPTHRLVLVPSLFEAAQTRRCRVFQNLNVPEIVARVLDGLGLVSGGGYQIALVGRYPKRDYVVQYEETDLAFMSRLLEDEGIAFRIDPGAETDTVVLSDSNDGMRDVASMREVRASHGPGALERGVISAFAHTRSVVPRTVLLVDYDWRKPALTLESALEVDPGGRGLVSTSEQHYRDGAYGQRLARVRAEELLVERDVYRGCSTIDGLTAGDRFTLNGHDDAELDGQYLVVESRWHYDQSFFAAPAGSTAATAATAKGHGNEFVAIRTSVAFRPARTTPKPRIDGLLYATVDGPEIGTPAPIDEQGRYKIILPFDLDAEVGGNASCWIRMAQPLSGPGFGVHFPLREGAEVVLSHVLGDPDRPVIVGAVPNPETPSPVTRSNATQSKIRTSSGIEVEFEDDA